MSKYFDCFDNALEDGIPSRWSGINTASPISAGNLSINPVLGVYPVKRRAMRWETNATVSATAFTALEGTEGVGTHVSLMCFRSKQAAKAGVFRYHCVVGEHTFVGVFEGYRVEFHNDQSGTPNRIVMAGGTLNGTAAKTIDSTKTYYAKVQVSSTGFGFYTVSARVWCPDDEDEPTTWDLQDTDTQYDGLFGYCGVSWGSSIASGLWGGDVNFLSVNSSGASVKHALHGDFRDTYEPITNTEFQQWCDHPNERCWAVKMTAVGYSPSGSGVSPSVYYRDVPVYISSRGFSTQSWDEPANTRFLPVLDRPPEFGRELSVQLRGRATTNLGEIAVKNPRPSVEAGGVRDTWARTKWKRNYCIVKLGDPNWSLSDFRTVVLGRTLRPTAPRPDIISFQIADLSDYFKEDVNPMAISGGPYDGQRLPRMLGELYWGGESSHQQLEPPLTDEDNLIYTLSEDVLGSSWLDAAFHMRVYDDQVPIDSDPVAITISPAGQVWTTASDHGAVEGWTCYLTGTVALPFVANTKYHVVGYGSPLGITGNTLALSATAGGAPISNSVTPINCTAYLFGWDYDNAGPTTITLASEAVGRVTCTGMRQSAMRTSEDVYREIARTAGMPDCLVDPDCDTVFPDASDPTTGLWIGTEKTSCEQALERHSAGTLSWYNVAPEGAFQFGVFKLPEDIDGDPVLELNASNTMEGSLIQTGLVLPVDFSKAEIRALPWWLRGGPFQDEQGPALQGATIETPTPYTGNPVAPLDDYPEIGEMNPTFKWEKLLHGNDYVREIHAKALGVFEVRARLGAIFTPIGSKVQLTHPRMGWKNYDGITEIISPDNGEAFDARQAVVMGVHVRPSKDDMFPVTLTLLRRNLGYYPTDEQIAGLFFLLLSDGSYLLQSDGSSRVHLAATV